MFIRPRAQARDLSSSGLSPSVTVEDLAALKALTSRPGAVLVKTARAAGIWQWVSGSATTADDALVVQCTSGASGRYKRQLDGTEYRPEWWGAVGDGVTDDTVPVNACILAAAFLNSSQGACVRFSAKTYLGNFVGKSFVSLRGESMGGTILTNTTGTIVSYTDEITLKVVISDMSILGAASVTTGLFVGSDTEITAIMKLDNIQIKNHALGLDGASKTFVLFDSELTNVDFFNCTTTGNVIAGSGMTFTGCKFRSCGQGALIKEQNAGSSGGPRFFGCLWAANASDVVFDGAYIRQTLFSGCWMETASVECIGTLTAGTQIHQSTVFENVLFQPGAAASGIVDLNAIKGIFSFKNCVAFNAPLAGATLPDETWASITAGSTVYERIGCVQSDGVTVTPLKDVTVNASGTYHLGDLTLGATAALKFSGGSQVKAGSADGNVLLQNAAGSAFGILQLGGTGVGNPGLKAVGAGLEARLANDSGVANFNAGTISVRSAGGLPAGGSTNFGVTISAAGIGYFAGSGPPSFSAPKGSHYGRSDGSTTNDRAYVATDSVGGWTAFITAS